MRHHRRIMREGGVDDSRYYMMRHISVPGLTLAYIASATQVRTYDLIVQGRQQNHLDTIFQNHAQRFLVRLADRTGGVLEFEQLSRCGILEPLKIRLNDRASRYTVQRAEVDAAHRQHGDLLEPIIVRRRSATFSFGCIRYDSNGTECPIAPTNGLSVVRRPDMSLRNESGDEVRSDNTAL